MVEKIKQRIITYFKKESKWNILFNFLTLILIILLLIPSTRQEILPRILRLTLFSPNVIESNEQDQLNGKDFAYQFKDSLGEMQKLSEWKGEVILVNIWATWCAPCVAEMPSLQDLYNDYKGKVKFVFLTNEGSEVTTPFMKKRGFDLPVSQIVYRLPEKMQTGSIPATFLITKSGKIAIRKVGTAKWNSSAVRETLDQLIAEEKE